MIKKLEDLGNRIAECLGIEAVPIEFGEIKEGSRLFLVPDVRIVINKRFSNDYFECAKAVVHELRPAFQITWASLMDDEKARRWRRELEGAPRFEDAIINSDNAMKDYFVQDTELDAFAFTKYYLEEYEGLEVIHPSNLYEELISKYLELNSNIL